MKKFLITAAATSLLIFGGQTSASAETTAESLDTQSAQTQEMSRWAHIRDKYILGRETENERRDRKEWERRHRYGAPPPPPGRHGGYGAPPPPPGRHGGYGAPPPPPGRHGDYGAPPPPPGRHGDYGAPPPPPPGRHGDYGAPPPPPRR